MRIYKLKSNICTGYYVIGIDNNECVNWFGLDGKTITSFVSYSEMIEL